MGKQMEGDNTQRRNRARQARAEGTTPSHAQVTLGASKASEHLPHHTGHAERQRSPERGKQRSEVDRGLRKRAR
ncbi:MULTISPECIES: hypothetical protein [Actinoalloteichus]|uniref:Uncharacterized protein n=1 Tax=Actinoalloteichus caeruleus DSM 43889 TaxID=1120930 RepID=A0ABT1JH43_ACTCY|nr:MULTISPECIES: hypothetical protein [Actinoalloteichus]MCP2331822.1 hypothetical protein [Actinoalloteichus caeruleus DSM 43889]